MKKRFNFSRAEKVGVAVLSLIILILLVIINRPKETFMPNVFLTDTTSVKYISSPKKEFYSKKKGTNSVKQKVAYQSFNPNNYSKSEWQKIGFSEKQASVILNYKTQINGFKSEQDLANCFVIDDKKFDEMQPFLKFEKPKADTVRMEMVEIKPTIVELNTANQIQLETIRGIGPFYAKQILEYGNKLGGYCRIEQVKEVFGMTEEAYNLIADQLAIDNAKISKIEIATAKFDQLRKHPYLNWKQCQIIMALPKKEINEQFWIDLEKNEAFNITDVNKLKPYFK